MSIAENEMVAVTWTDAWFDLDPPAEHREEFPVTTVGFLIEQNEKWISVAAEQLPDNAWRAITHIPVGVIRTIRPVMLGAPR
jgi:hypothetical protein